MNPETHILDRVRKALQVPAAGHLPGSHHPAPPATPAAATDYSRYLPAVGAGFEEQVAHFARNSLELKTDFRLLPDVDAVREALQALAASEGWKRVGLQTGQEVRAATESLGVPSLSVDGRHGAEALAQCEAGVTECDALVAQTGTVVVTSRSAGGRALSCLPPHHVVLARREQLVAGLPEAFALLKSRYGGSYPSMISFITGPSRTGDIERILVLGAHGPRKLTVLCW